MPSHSYPLALLGLAALLPLVATGATESVERVEPYTLQLGPDGRPLPGYFYLGFVHGLPDQAVQLGFNARQSSTRSSAPFHNQPFPAPGIAEDAFGLRYYSLAWSANSLAEASRWAHDKAGRNASLSAAEQRLVSLPPTLDAEGKVRPPTARRASLNLFDPATIDLLKTYLRGHVDAWSKDIPGKATGTLIDRWGLDNEWEGERGPDYSPEARAAFARWLAKAHDNRIDKLNTAWRTAHRDFASAADGPLPAPADYADQPGAFLDWWTFQTEHFVTTLADLARTMHEADPLRRGVVHKATQQTIEMPGVNRTHLFDHDLFAELMRPLSGGLYGIDMYGAGDRQAYELNYIFNCIRPLDGAPGYGVSLPETNNHGGPGNAFAATAWRMLANGLKAADLFTMGFAGAQGDWDKFGFIVPATGAPKDKLFYAGRWAHAIRRTEAFWTESVPAPDMPRVALLMPRRDVLLSPLSERTNSRWSYPRNHRWMVYRWLREQGYWVDVIPYSKLADLSRYQGLFLIGAAHLTDHEKKLVESFASAGGILVTDTNVAAYDEHHAPRPSGLLPFIPVEVGSAELALELGGHSVVAQGAHAIKSTGSARVVASSVDKKPAAILQKAGKGRVLHFPFELGSLVLRRPGQAMPAFLAEGPTADSEEYIIPEGELVFGQWLGALLREAGLKPSVTASTELAASGNLRVEQPYVDAAGNLAVVVTTRADSAKRPLVPGTVTLPLPGGPWKTALLAPAEHDGLIEIPVRAVSGGLHELTLPALPTAGIVYLFKRHDPLLGIPAIDAPARSIDGHTAKIAPGAPFRFTVQLHNTTGRPLPAGSLRALAPTGWTLASANAATPALAAGASHATVFTVTPEADPALVKPDWIYPLVVRWSDGNQDRAVISANVEIDTNAADIPLLLTGNAHYPATYPHRLDIGATYRHLGDARLVSDPARSAKGVEKNTGLTNGFNSRIGLRTSGSSLNAYAVAFKGDSASVEFDLQSTRNVRRVVVTAGPGDMLPTSLLVTTSTDGTTFTAPVEITPAPQGLAREFTFHLPPTEARHVRLGITWPAAGGTLDEIEIWGR